MTLFEFRIMATVTAMVLTACSSAPLALPTEVSRFESTLELKSKSQVWARAQSKHCKEIAGIAKFEILPQKAQALAMKTTCEGTRLVAKSPWLAAGQYQMRLSLRRHSLKELKPQITLELANPDYRSGPDQYAEGAVPMEPGKALEGSVHYLDGDASDWLRVVGEKKRVFLTFVPPEGSTVSAAVFRSFAGGTPRKLRGLLPGRPTAFYLGKEDLLIKVVGTNEEGAVAYTLLRRDEDAQKAVPLQVVDTYPVGSNSSLVLLRPSPLIKVDAELRISAKAANGQWKELGACRVSQASSDGIQCELSGAWSERFTEYRAVGTAPVSG
jgi:hypothetical protein